MKKSILICILALGLAFPAFASDICKAVESLAENTMKARQAGSAASDMLGIGEIEGVKGTNESKLLKIIVLSAFEVPRYSSPEYRRRAVEDFKNEWYIWCIRR